MVLTKRRRLGFSVCSIFLQSANLQYQSFNTQVMHLVRIQKKTGSSVVWELLTREGWVVFEVVGFSKKG